MYATCSHKYCDGGSGAALVHALAEHYDARVERSGKGGAAGEAIVPAVLVETPVLRLQHERLVNYLMGLPSPAGGVDAMFMDINHDSFSHGHGQGVGVEFSTAVCDMMRLTGKRMVCSEEIAWLSCILCALFRLMPDERLLKIMIVHNGRMGEAENVIACTNQYVMLTIPCGSDRANTPLADVASRVKYAVTNGKFHRPGPCEQSHAKINIGGMAGADGSFRQVFRTARPKKGMWSRAQHCLQLRMDNEGGTWIVKDFKIHCNWTPQMFWEATVCAGVEISRGLCTNPLAGPPSWS